MSGDTRVKRSTKRTVSPGPRWLPPGIPNGRRLGITGPPSCWLLIWVVSTTSVFPSQRPREMPSHDRTLSAGRERPSSGTMIGSLELSVATMIPAYPGAWMICRMESFPSWKKRTNAVSRHRSLRLRSSHPSASPRPRLAASLASSRLTASGVNGGIRPSGGSTTSEVRFQGVIRRGPPSTQKRLYSWPRMPFSWAGAVFFSSGKAGSSPSAGGALLPTAVATTTVEASVRHFIIVSPNQQASMRRLYTPRHILPAQRLILHIFVVQVLIDPDELQVLLPLESNHSSLHRVRPGDIG